MPTDQPLPPIEPAPAVSGQQPQPTSGVNPTSSPFRPPTGTPVGRSQDPPSEKRR